MFHLRVKVLQNDEVFLHVVFSGPTSIEAPAGSKKESIKAGTATADLVGREKEMKQSQHHQQGNNRRNRKLIF